MSTYLGPFYIRDGDIFLLSAVALLLLSLGLGLTVPFIGTRPLLLLIILFLVTRGLLPVGAETTIYLVFISAVLVAIFFPLSIALLYVVISFVLLKVTRQLQ